MATEPKPLATVAIELATAVEKLDQLRTLLYDAQMAASAARREETDRVNRVNDQERIVKSLVESLGIKS